MSAIEESDTSENLFRETGYSDKFKGKIQKGHQFNESSYSKGFFAKEQDPAWMDEKMLDLHLDNQETKQNIRPKSKKSNKPSHISEKKSVQALKQNTQQSQIDNSSNIVINKQEPIKKKKESIQIIKNEIVSPLQQAYLDNFKKILPQNTFFQCEIRRVKSIFQSKYSLVYNDTQLLNIKKSEGVRLTNKFDILCSNCSQHAIGSLSSNFMGSFFSITQQFSQTNTQQQTAEIYYQEQPIFSSNPRSIQIYLLKQNCIIVDLSQARENKSLKQRYFQGQTQSIAKISTKKSLRSQQNKCYLNFDKNSIPSVKNTILQDQSGNQVLYFIKTDENKFKLTIRPPFSVLSGYSLTISSLLFKLASQ